MTEITCVSYFLFYLFFGYAFPGVTMRRPPPSFSCWLVSPGRAQIT